MTQQCQPLSCINYAIMRWVLTNYIM
jgi:hypothetical protein